MTSYFPLLRFTNRVPDLVSFGNNLQSLVIRKREGGKDTFSIKYLY